MTLRKNRLGQKSRGSRIESLEGRTLLSADGLCPSEPPGGPAVSGPLEPDPTPDAIPDPTLFEDVEGEFGDSIANATQMRLFGNSGDAFGNIGHPTDVDVFAVEPLASRGFVEVFPEAEGLALSVKVLDAAGNLVAEADSILPPGEGLAATEFQIDTDELFYVSVESSNGAEGGYALDVHLEVEGGGSDGGGHAGNEIDVDSELGDDIHSGALDETATQLDFEDNFARVASNIDRDADSDTFRFVAKTELTHVDVIGELPLIIHAYDAEGNLISEAEDLLIGEPEFPEDAPRPYFAVVPTVPGETYFISLGSTKGRVGTYEMFVFATEPVEPPTPDAPFGKDIHGDALDSATQLGPIIDLDAEREGIEVISNIDSESDVDVFLFSTLGGHLLGDVFSFDGTPLNVQLLNEAGESVLPGNEGEPEFDPLHALEEIDEGTYYLKISGVPSTYQFFLHVDPIHADGPVTDPDSSRPVEVDAPLGEDAHGDDVETATLLNFDEDRLVSVLSNIDHETDRDVFAVTANENGDEIIFDLVSQTEGLALDLVVLGPNGEEVLAEIEGFGSDGDFTDGTPVIFEGFLDPEVGETYYLSVGTNDGTTGTYQLNVFNPTRSDLPIDPTPVEPVDPETPFIEADAELGDDLHAGRLEDATKLALNDEEFIEISSNIDFAGDVDAFVFEGNGNPVIAEWAEFGANKVTFQVFGNGALITESDQGFLEFETANSETYFLIAQSSVGETGQYFIALQSMSPLGTVCCDPVEPIDPNPVEPTGPLDPIPPGLPGEDETTNDEARKLVADLDGNGVVGFKDFLILSSNFGREVDAAFADGDVDGNGSVDMADFLLLSAEYGDT